MSTIG